MEKQELFDALSAIVGSAFVHKEELLSRHTSFRIGGPADCFVNVGSIEEMQKCVALLKQENVPFFILGNGSNLLVHDDGYRGVVLEMTERMQDIQIDGQQIVAQAGASLIRVAKEAEKNSLTGLEFASGIPGSIGGAVMMNAGAYGGEMKDVLVNATVLNIETGEIEVLPVDALELGYRTSVIATGKYVVLESTMKLQVGDATEISNRVAELAASRREKQPLQYPSAGSTFKRPEGYFAGKLISDAGLKGYTIGGAQISEKHAGFVINIGDATAADVIALTDAVSAKVQELYGVALELEVKKLGF